MAQDFPTSAQDIYDVIEKLHQHGHIALGTYKINAGNVFKDAENDKIDPEVALTILSPGEELPSTLEVEGIECIIQDTGDFTKNEYITNQPARLTINWSVFLVAWSPKTGADMQTITEKICSKFYGSEAVQTVATDKGIGAKVQTKIIIKSDMPIIHSTSS